MKVSSTFVLAVAFSLAGAAAGMIRSENDFARRLQAASGSAGPDRLRSWVFAQLGASNDLDGRNIVPSQRWKDRVGDKAIIPYQIETRYFSQAQIAQIERAANNLSDQAKVFQLVKRTTQSAFIRVVDITGGCSSSVGKDPSGKSQDLNLASGCFVDGIIQHELMHALGFFHEQVRTQPELSKLSLWFLFSSNTTFSD